MPLSLVAIQEEIQQCKLLMRLLTERLGGLEAMISAEASTDGNKNPDLFHSQISERNKGAENSLSQNSERNNNPVSPTSQNSEWNKTDILSNSQNGDWNKEDVSSPSQIGEGNKNNFSSTPQNTCPIILPANEASAKALRIVLKREEPSLTRRRTRANVAMFLLKILEAPGGHSQQRIAAMFGMSKGGVAKFMMMLFRRGLIVRTAFQQYAPSEKAAAFMRTAAAGLAAGAAPA